jgi:F-type H+-transporting ATPase subunit gamma
MATLRDIKRRIKGVQNTQQITKAMKMVAAAKLRRAQENVLNARPYAKRISTMLAHLVTEEDILNNPYIKEKEVHNIAVVIVTADRGLCGAFNANIIKETSKYIDEELKNGSIKTSVFCVGKKGFDFFGKRDYNIAGKSIGFFNTLQYFFPYLFLKIILKKTRQSHIIFMSPTRNLFSIIFFPSTLKRKYGEYYLNRTQPS